MESLAAEGDPREKRGLSFWKRKKLESLATEGNPREERLVLLREPPRFEPIPWVYLKLAPRPTRPP